MQFIWDPRKAVANLRANGISFEEASSAFSDNFALTGADPDHSIGEQRWKTFGESPRGRRLAVSHTDFSI